LAEPPPEPPHLDWESPEVGVAIRRFLDVFEATGRPDSLDRMRELVAGELRYPALAIVGVGRGLRPEELFALHRSDVDRSERLLWVRRRFTGGVLKEGGKTDGSVRTVPLRQRVLEALDAMPKRIDTPILFPAARGGYIDVEKFRQQGVHLWHLATVMGTSVVQLQDTYARWLKRTDDQRRAAFDAYDSPTTAAGAESQPLVGRTHEAHALSQPHVP
jgi:integrase